MTVTRVYSALHARVVAGASSRVRRPLGDFQRSLVFSLQVVNTDIVLVNAAFLADVDLSAFTAYQSSLLFTCSTDE